jgi:predicted dehydrogenase
MVSRHHLIAWASLADDASVVAIADPSSENAKRRASEFGIHATFSTAGEMLSKTELDAVDIAAPRAYHAELVRLAAERNLAILCQKPLAPTLRQAEELVAEVDAKARLMIHENWRFRGYYRQAAAWLRENRVGPVKQAQLTLLTSGVLLDSNGRRPALARQPFMRSEKRMLVEEVLIHHLDTLRVLMGPLRVKAAALSRTCPELFGEDGAVIQLETQNGGAAVSIFASFAADGYPAAQIDRLEILGESGSIRLDGNLLTCSGKSPAERHYDLATEYQGSYNAAIAHFVDALQSGRPFETSPGDNLQTLRLVEDCYRLSNWEVA